MVPHLKKIELYEKVFVNFIVYEEKTKVWNKLLVNTRNNETMKTTKTMNKKTQINTVNMYLPF